MYFVFSLSLSLSLSVSVSLSLSLSLIEHRSARWGHRPCPTGLEQIQPVLSQCSPHTYRRPPLGSQD